MSSITALTLFASIILGQPASEEDRTRLNDVDCTSTRTEFEEYSRLMQGRWVCTKDGLLDLTPAFQLKGDEDARMSFCEIRAVVKGHALQGVWSGGNGQARWLSVWDPALKQIRGFVAVTDGTLWEDVRYKEGDNWRCKTTLKRADGSTAQMESILTFSDDGNTHTYRPADGGDIGGVYRRVE